MAYAAPGLSASEIATAVAAEVGLDTTNDATVIYQAITEAANIASVWQREAFWWALGYNTFPTVSTTKSYNLRTVNTNAMTDMWAPLALWYTSNRRLIQVHKSQYDEWNAVLSDTGSPGWYALAGDLTAHIWPTPDAAYTIAVSYVRRHGKLTSSSVAADLLVPADFHWGIYVVGASKILKSHQMHDPSFLLTDKEFEATLRRMRAADPTRFDGNTDDRQATWVPGFPPNAKVFSSADGLSV